MAEAPHHFGDARDEATARLTSFGIETAFQPIDEEAFTDEPWMLFNYPEAVGGATRRYELSVPRAEKIMGIDLANLRLFPGHYGIVDLERRYIELELICEFGSVRRLSRVAGVERKQQDGTFQPECAGDAGNSGEEQAEAPKPAESGWRLPLVDSKSSLAVEISPCSDVLDPWRQRTGGRRRLLSLKIQGLDGDVESQVEEAREIGASIFFEIDVRFDIELSFSLYSGGPRIRRRPRRADPGEPVRLPEVKYGSEAVELYFYGRGARGMPLLEFLAFYQAIEFFYPQYTRLESIRRVRQALRDPSFSKERDSDVARLLNIVEPRRGNHATEEEQLRATLEHCISSEELDQFFESNQSEYVAVQDKARISHVHAVNPNNRQMTLLAQVAKRMYDIRCRIVHSKSDGGPRGAEMLLPASDEAKKLSADANVIQWLAQRVIIASASVR